VSTARKATSTSPEVTSTSPEATPTSPQATSTVAAVSRATRVAPLKAPYDPELERTLERMMPPGVAPLRLFRTVAHNPHMLDKLRSTGSYLLNFGTLPAADRELVIHRVCGRCGCEYEWGVHVVFFGRAMGFTDAQLESTVSGEPSDPVWSDHEAMLIELVDQLHDSSAVTDELFSRLEAHYNEAQLVELMTLVGQYHAVSFVANALGVELEDGAARFPASG
jgi:4-carboxymuconolactone decarboxylase